MASGAQTHLKFTKNVDRDYSHTAIVQPRSGGMFIEPRPCIYSELRRSETLFRP